MPTAATTLLPASSATSKTSLTGSARLDNEAELELCFFLQLRFVLDAIIAGQSADEVAALPVGENAAETFTRDARHRREIALADLLVDDDAASANILAEVVRQVE
jgi:hypothetical protein